MTTIPALLLFVWLTPGWMLGLVLWNAVEYGVRTDVTELSRIAAVLLLHPLMFWILRQVRRKPEDWNCFGVTRNAWVLSFRIGYPLVAAGPAALALFPVT
jgi:hypothetical protein